MPQLKPSGTQRLGRNCLTSFGFLWLGFALFWTFMAWRSGGGMMALFGIPFILIGIAMIVGSFWRVIAGIKVAPPKISISKDRCHLGERIGVVYEQAFRMPSEVLDSRIELVFRESATYQQGTDTRTDTHEVVPDFFDGPIKNFEAGELVRESGTLNIPVDGMHSFVDKHNKLQWFVRVKVDVQGWPDQVEEFEVTVLPERFR
jgi:hypothetical protein